MTPKKTLAIFTVASALLALSLPIFAQAQADGQTYLIVVNAKNPAASIKRPVIKQLFLKRRLTWEDGSQVDVVDLPANAPARTVFSEDLLKMQVGEVVSYWRKQVFSGTATPPPTKASDEAVVKFVATHPGAIGYVSAGANVGKLRVLTVEK